MPIDKSKAFWSFVYSLSQISLGLLSHPYKTMQLVVKGKLFSFVTLLPTAFLVFIILSWRLIITPLIRIFYSCSSQHIFLCDFLPFLAHFMILFCFFWQLMLVYLLFRFYLLYRSPDQK